MGIHEMTRKGSGTSGQRRDATDNSRAGFKPDGLQPAIRVVMMPRDANYLGTIFGGVILSSLDLAGAVAAHQHTNQKFVTVAMHEVKFIAPVFVGDLVSFYTKTVKVGRTSLTIRVTVEATRAEAPHETVRVTQAEIVYVAIDATGKPVLVRS
jgi:acyl-CoA thioesterase YciA